MISLALGAWLLRSASMVSGSSADSLASLPTLHFVPHSHCDPVRVRLVSRARVLCVCVCARVVCLHSHHILAWFALRIQGWKFTFSEYAPTVNRILNNVVANLCASHQQQPHVETFVWADVSRQASTRVRGVRLTIHACALSLSHARALALSRALQLQISFLHLWWHDAGREACEREQCCGQTTRRDAFKVWRCFRPSDGGA